jgi:aminoglycoside 3-N-acetyltransferase
MEVKRNRNVKIFQHYFNMGFTVNKVDVGDGSIWGYSCRDFCKATTDYLRQDIYGWMDEPPAERPYQR